MKYLLLFESFLESGYEPLYRYMPWFFENEMLKDKMEKRIPCDEESMSRQEHRKPIQSISFTRSSHYKYDGSTSLRIKFDQNKLRIDGYKPYPIDEFRGKNKFRKFKEYNKDWKLWHCMEWEYEERIYSDIEKIGKYIISIQVPNKSKYRKELASKEFKEYLKKYPHIKVEIYDTENRWKTRKLIS